MGIGIDIILLAQSGFFSKETIVGDLNIGVQKPYLILVPFF